MYQMAEHFFNNYKKENHMKKLTENEMKTVAGGGWWADMYDKGVNVMKDSWEFVLCPKLTGSDSSNICRT